jgi:hypothetical protein
MLTKALDIGIVSKMFWIKKALLLVLVGLTRKRFLNG